MIRVQFAELTANILRGLAYALTWIGDLANPVLASSRLWQQRAREWNPRLWDRTGRRGPP
ncbi:hypothetical protein [Methylobacterium gregans]|uniref:Uncharacterized protein n=1 Tax=Methylobacterium gregans TaxID=374424 RepID=A0AA37HLU7_9HYPH|nr:hypothetical protein [Methylobacterium gregans]MDQ0521989.1 hypothetical protein [Methylobacterium gregans]GJD77978.1 hypothetical protein NBEOAGPD_1190 [Methylobacterium gregans]GLS51947.1 hypothetical protein GCM10007886_01290 [Methylobacterium gregans]